MDEQRRRFLLGAAYYAVLAGLGWLFFRHLLWWLLPFLLAYGTAEAIEPAVRLLRRRLRVKRGFAAVVVTLFLLFLLGGLLSLLVSSLAAEVRGALGALAGLLDELPTRLAGLLARLEAYCTRCPDWLRTLVEGALTDSSRYVRAALELLVRRLPALLASLAGTLPRLALGGATTVLAVFFCSASLPTLHASARRYLPVRVRERLRRLGGGAMRSLGQWLRAQALLCLMTFVQLLAALSLLGTRFALLGAVGITLVDMLPVFGTGTVLVPWALAELLLGAPARGAALLALYLCTLTVRSVAEPKLLASRAGVPPVASLAAMYLGFRAFGIGGMVLLPLLLLLAAQTGSEEPVQ